MKEVEDRMGIMMSKSEDDKTELNKRITADLRARAQNSKQDDPDYVDDAAYIKDTKKTGKFGWVWIVLIVLAILSIIAIIG